MFTQVLLVLLLLDPLTQVVLFQITAKNVVGWNEPEFVSEFRASAPVRSALVRIALANAAPLRFVPRRFAPVRSIPGAVLLARMVES